MIGSLNNVNDIGFDHPTYRSDLVRLDHMKDLGVIFDTELNFVQHCKEQINTAYSYLGIIKRNFIYFVYFHILITPKYISYI